MDRERQSADPVKNSPSADITCLPGGGGILSHINSPADIKTLTVAELEHLGGEIRRFLLKNLSPRGGHLAPNLGVVELTLALHYVFDAPTDQLIWDVGHQSYVHKILTGRREQIDTLRQFHGLSGFPKRSESVYDSFGVGHSSTSISAALGMAAARDLAGADNAVVAVIGDGALTGGMAFEALNNAGQIGKKLLVVLNDNAMSIAPNVGAMAMYLNRLRSAPRYQRTKEKVEEGLSRFPGIGPGLAGALEKIKNTLRYMMVPGTLFEELGFTYIGPVDGHNVGELIAVLDNVRAIDAPVLLHVVTQKGRGYRPAAGRPDLFHGVGPFDLATGQTQGQSGQNFTDVFGEKLVEMAREDDKIVAFTAAMTSGTGLSAFAEAFPERFFDVGICEQHAVTMAAGLAVSGYRPFVCVYSTFLQRAYDQIIHDVALQKLPVVFAVDRAGLVGEDGATHHGAFDLAALRLVPNLTIFAPADAAALRQTMELARTAAGPVIIRYPKAAAAAGTKDFSAGRVERTGEKILFLTSGRMRELAADTATELTRRYGLHPTRATITQIKPLPAEWLLPLIAGHDYLVSLEDGCVTGGLGSAVLELCADHDLAVKSLRLGLPDAFVEQGAVAELWAELGLTPEQITARIIERWPGLA